MFAVGLDSLEISPIRMKFQGWWIYNLQTFHPHWKIKVQKEICPHFFFSTSAWGALLKAYNLNVFSPIFRLRPFAEDYHQHLKNDVSSREIEKIFFHLYQLGIDKIGHLRRIPSPQIHRAFGKSWLEFFKGVMEPERSVWKWTNFTAPKVLKAQIDPEYGICESLFLLEEIYRSIELWAKEASPIFFNKLRIQLNTFDSFSDRKIEIEFPQRTCLQQDLAWVKRSLKERLLQVELFSPVSKIHIFMECSPPRQSVQLALFQDRLSNHQLAHLCSKLKNQGYSAFVPRITNSQVPEQSWERAEPSLNFKIKGEAFFRPLLQYSPVPILPPEGKLQLTEKIQWIDERGNIHSRHYFICRSFRKWKWVFQDEKKNWFEQGVLE